MFDGDLFSDPTEYRSVVEALHLTLTRSNISFAVDQACQYIHRLGYDNYCILLTLKLYYFSIYLRFLDSDETVLY